MTTKVITACDICKKEIDSEKERFQIKRVSGQRYKNMNYSNCNIMFRKIKTIATICTKCASKTIKLEE